MLDPARSPGLWEPTAEFGSVGWLVPWSQRYPAFTRLFHPIHGTGWDPPRTWRALAERAGRTWHPEVQFGSIDLLPDVDCSAALADLGEDSLARLVPLLGAPDDKCWFGLWAGGGWVDGPIQSPEGAAIDRSGWESAGVLSAPIRQYRCFRAKLADLKSLGLPWVRQPTLAWSDEFCLATDPDYDSSILAADPRVQQQVLDCPGLEALPVEPTTSLLWDADKVNGIPPHKPF